MRNNNSDQNSSEMIPSIDVPSNSIKLQEFKLNELDADSLPIEKLIEKSVIVHRDEDGFGLRIKGHWPAYVEHVHEGGAAWRAGVRKFDTISKVNGLPVGQVGHKEIVLMFKSCTRFVALTLLSAASEEFQHSNRTTHELNHQQRTNLGRNHHLSVNSQLSLTRHLQTASSNFTTSDSRSPISLRREPPYASGPMRRQVASLKIGRRDSNDSLGSQKAADKRLAVCVPCRMLLGQQADDKIGAARTTQDFTCASCQLKFRQPTRRKDSTAAGQQQRQDQLQRTYGSLRDSPASKQQSVELSKAAGVEAEPRGFKLSQSASASSLPIDQAPPPAPISKPRPVTSKRIEIIREFIDTERTHTERLRYLDELFYRPLKTGGFLTNEQLRQVFSCHRTLYKVHRLIYRILLSANYNLCSEPLVGSALLEIFEGELKKRLERAACSFCSAQATNVELLNKLTRRESKVGDFLAQITSQRMVGRLGIKDLLASCFQRLTKYPLLLENLLKATPLAPPEEDETPARARRLQASHSSDDSDEGEEEKENDENQEDELRRRNSRRMLAISLAEEREFIERALQQSRQILVRVNESIKVATSNHKLKEIWKRTDKYPGVPLIDISKQQVVHEGPLTLRLSKRSFDVYVLLLNDYLIILTREGQDKYRLKFFTPEGKSSSSLGSSSSASANQQSVYSPVFVIDEHLATRDAATDENGFYLLCKRKDDSRIYEFASRSPAERIKWRDRIQWTIERQMSRGEAPGGQGRRPSCESTITKSSSDISARRDPDELGPTDPCSSLAQDGLARGLANKAEGQQQQRQQQQQLSNSNHEKQSVATEGGQKDDKPTKIVGTISYVEDDGIVMPSRMESSRALVERAIQVNVFSDDGEQRRLLLSSNI